LAGFQQAASAVNAQSEPAQQQKNFYKQSLSNATGVNVDSELVYLTTLQNSYSASAHVISTINQMLQDLEGIL
jgi:flagellar hook-associated protein 1